MEGDLSYLNQGLIWGLCYGIAAIGLSLPLRFLRSADLTSLGALSVSGVVAVYVTNSSNWIVGGIAGALAAGLLGGITGFISIRWKIPLMLAGIITLTASQSLGLVIAKDGTISIDGGKDSGFHATFSWQDVPIVALLGVLICVAGGIVARSKFGVRAFALTGSLRFVEYRHRDSTGITLWILFLANALVGLAGSIFALKSGSGHALLQKTEFLSIALGAIFAGDACLRLIARKVSNELPEELKADLEPKGTGSNPHVFMRAMSLHLSSQRDDSSRLGLIFLSYLAASFVLNSLIHGVRGQHFGPIDPRMEHILVAVVVLLGLIISNRQDKAKPRS